MLKTNKKISLIDGRQVKVGYAVLDIKEQAPQFKKSNMTDCYGQYTARENIIEVQPGLSDIDEANTVLHEIMHACVYISSLNTEGQALSDDNNEEVVVNSLSNYLMQVFMDNKWLLPYLNKKILDK